MKPIIIDSFFCIFSAIKGLKWCGLACASNKKACACPTQCYGKDSNTWYDEVCFQGIVPRITGDHSGEIVNRIQSTAHKMFFLLIVILFLLLLYSYFYSQRRVMWRPYQMMTSRIRHSDVPEFSLLPTIPTQCKHQRWSLPGYSWTTGKVFLCYSCNVLFITENMLYCKQMGK